MPAAPGTTIVNIQIPNNAWWEDTFQFGYSTDTTWSFAGKSFLCDIKTSASDAVAKLSLSSLILTITALNATIVVDDPVQRILHFYVDDHVLRANLPPGSYVYDLIMVTIATGERVPLMGGGIDVVQGVTVED